MTIQMERATVQHFPMTRYKVVLTIGMCACLCHFFQCQEIRIYTMYFFTLKVHKIWPFTFVDKEILLNRSYVKSCTRRCW